MPTIGEIHLRLEMQQSNNAKAIEGLTKTVDTLAKTMATDGKIQSKEIANLITTQKECTLRFEAIVDKISNKKERLDSHGDAIRELREDKADKQDFKDLSNRLWKIGGSVVSAGFAVTWALIMYITKGG